MSKIRNDNDRKRQRQKGALKRLTSNGFHKQSSAFSHDKEIAILKNRLGD